MSYESIIEAFNEATKGRAGDADSLLVEFEAWLRERGEGFWSRQHGKCLLAAEKWNDSIYPTLRFAIIVREYSSEDAEWDAKEEKLRGLVVDCLSRTPNAEGVSLDKMAALLQVHASEIGYAVDVLLEKGKVVLRGPGMYGLSSRRL